MKPLLIILATITAITITFLFFRNPQTPRKPDQDYQPLITLAQQVVDSHDPDAPDRVRQFEAALRTPAGASPLGGVPVLAILGPEWWLSIKDCNQLQVGVLSTSTSPCIITLQRPGADPKMLEMTMMSVRLMDGVYWHKYTCHMDRAANIIANDVADNSMIRSASSKDPNIRLLYDHLKPLITDWTIIVDGKSIPITLEAPPVSIPTTKPTTTEKPTTQY